MRMIALALALAFAGSLLTVERAAAQSLHLTQPALLRQAPAAALRDILPRTAHDKRLVGWILVGAGVVHLALTPVCLSEVRGRGGQVACVGATAVLGSAAIVVGALFLVDGYGAGHARRRRATAPLLSGLSIALGPGSGALTYRHHF